MGCDSLLMQTTLGGLRSGNASTDGLEDLIRSCPEICDQVYGTTNFDLAGPGVYMALIVQGVLVLLVGVLVSFISYVVSPHATIAAKLTVARLKVVFDTIYSTGLLVYIAILGTSFVRLYLGVEAGAFERSVIHDTLTLQRSMAYLGVNSYMAYRTPSGIKQPARRWGLERAWPAMLPLDLASTFVMSMTGGLPTDTVIRLCEASQPTTYTHIHKPLEWSFLVWVVCIAFSGTLILLFLNEFVRSSVWMWLKRIFTSKITIAIAVMAWTLMNLGFFIAFNYHLWFTREAMFARAKNHHAQWDLAQVLILTAWLPALYQIFLTFLVCLKTYFYTAREGSGAGEGLLPGLLSDMYNSNVGEEPRVEQQSEDHKVKGEK